MAFDDLRDLVRDLRDPAQLASGGLHPDQHRDGEAQGPGVDLGPVPGDHPGVLQPLDPLGHRGRRQRDPAAQLGEARPGVALELGQDPQVQRVQRFGFVGAARSAEIATIFGLETVADAALERRAGRPTEAETLRDAA